MGRAMLSKSLIQFSLEGQDCVPSWLFDLRPNYGGDNENNSNLLRKSLAHTAALSAPDPGQATANLHLCQRLLDTHGQVWVSVLWGHCSFLMGPGAHKVLFVPSQKSVSPDLCKFWWLYGGLMAMSSKRTYAIPGSAAPRAA